MDYKMYTLNEQLRDARDRLKTLEQAHYVLTLNRMMNEDNALAVQNMEEEFERTEYAITQIRNEVTRLEGIKAKDEKGAK